MATVRSAITFPQNQKMAYKETWSKPQSFSLLEEKESLKHAMQYSTMQYSIVVSVDNIAQEFFSMRDMPPVSYPKTPKVVRFCSLQH